MVDCFTVRNTKHIITEARGDINDYWTINSNTSQVFLIHPEKIQNIPSDMKEQGIVTIRTAGLLVTMDIIDAAKKHYFCAAWESTPITPDSWNTGS